MSTNFCIIEEIINKIKPEETETQEVDRDSPEPVNLYTKRKWKSEATSLLEYQEELRNEARLKAEQEQLLKQVNLNFLMKRNKIR